jgi:ubiquinone/menaquinone biosynthesis C-methylase UbiE
VTTHNDALNPFDAAALASRYEEWYAGVGRGADILEKELLGKLLNMFPKAHSVLEVGCGTGRGGFKHGIAARQQAVQTSRPD